MDKNELNRSDSKLNLLLVERELEASTLRS